VQFLRKDLSKEAKVCAIEVNSNNSFQGPANRKALFEA
jgi:hypothetical protein